MIAHAVPKKRRDLVDGYVAEQIRQDVLWLGRADIMIRSDSKPALLQVIDAALAGLKPQGLGRRAAMVPSHTTPGRMALPRLLCVC